MLLSAVTSVTDAQIIRQNTVSPIVIFTTVTIGGVEVAISRELDRDKEMRYDKSTGEWYVLMNDDSEMSFGDFIPEIHGDACVGFVKFEEEFFHFKKAWLDYVNEN
jgi:hypothetical protein